MSNTTRLTPLATLQLKKEPHQWFHNVFLSNVTSQFCQMNFKHFGMVDSSKYPWASAAIAVERVVASSKCFGDAVLNKKKKNELLNSPKIGPEL